MKLKRFIFGISAILILLLLWQCYIPERKGNDRHDDTDINNVITLFLCGDVMTGRGIDQILPNPGKPQIYESYMKDAKRYVRIAEKKNGTIIYPVDNKYIWGDALQEFERMKPDLKIINLETSITTNDSYWPGKGIQYRMHPKNIGSLTVVDKLFCSLGNNHILDWDYKGLKETIKVLEKAGIKHAGAGRNFKEANQPSLIEIKDKGRIVILAYAMYSAGLLNGWEAKPNKPGDIVVFSLHWGSNWGYEIKPEETQFVHRLIDSAQIDVFHGHSSHHFKAIEVYKNKLILYGCGDFINDYEGIGGKEHFGSKFALMYFANLDTKTGDLLKLKISPMEKRNFKLNKLDTLQLKWVKERLNRECSRFNGEVFFKKERLLLKW